MTSPHPWPGGAGYGPGGAHHGPAEVGFRPGYSAGPRDADDPGSGATIPPPPPGPGVRPPFAAAPVEGRAARVWLGLGLAGAVLALCCGAGVVAVGGLYVTAVDALNEQARAVTRDYLDAEIAGDWRQAYAQRCPQDRRAESQASFTDRVSSLPRIESYDLGEVQLTPAGQLRMPAEVRYRDGGGERLTVPLRPNEETGRLQVCGLRR